ncbi:HEAT repeat domain-containing protein [Streptomyces sp. NBC_01335]|uniref:HEAT repeat domain-containing protein n=1 Tax=Streptomyces sp. NBC_01335 TaxID=2903828 RepID=UPI003FA39F6A
MSEDTLNVMDEESRSLTDAPADLPADLPTDSRADVPDGSLDPLTDRLRDEAGAAGEAECARLAATADREELARVLVEPGRPLWARELAAFRLGCAGDRRAFEALVLLLNHRDPERCVRAAHALAELRDPRTPRAAAALATNPLRSAYALHSVRLLTALRAPESAPALIATLEGLLAPGGPHWRVALACVEGLGQLGDDRARPVLESALPHPRLSGAAAQALGRLPLAGDPTTTP